MTAVLVACTAVFAVLSFGGWFDKKFEVRVSGTAGLKFQGSYMVISGGSSNSRSVEGTVPTSYQAECQMISVAFQKKDRVGKLTVTVLKNGKVVKSEETTAEYGMVTIASD